MRSRYLFIGLIAWWAGLIARAAELPPRPAGAEGGVAFARRVAAMDAPAREEAVAAEVRRGNVPAFWRKFVEVKLDGAVVAVAPEYLCVGSDEDYWLAPLTPGTAQRIADELGCVLPTRKMVNAIWQAAVKLEPAPLPPSPEMTTVPVFSQHNDMVRRARASVLAQFPLGALIAGHKKDVVITPRLATAPNKVAIYGWHRPDGSPIQPLFTGHAATWADYSHGIRLVKKEMTLNGKPTTVEAVLADPQRCEALSDEGPIAQARYDVKSGAAAVGVDEKLQEMTFDSGVRAVINVPARLDPAKPTKLVIYGAPAGNTIEQTMGRKIAAGEDWHFDIQHIAAQTRWLRTRMPEVNFVVAYVQAKERSFVLWKRAQPEHPKLAVKIVEALKGEFPGATLVLTGHSAGGAFTFSYLDGLEKIPDDVERIAFLDSNYAYETEKHAKKLVEWLKGAESRRLCVLAYQDYLALLDGKTFVSEKGGTWGRSQAMLRDFGAEAEWKWEQGRIGGGIGARAKSGASGVGSGALLRLTALGGRVEFLLKENPEKLVLHTRQVELNGFIHGMLAGTEREGQGYEYLGERAYGEMIGEK